MTTGVQPVIRSLRTAEIAILQRMLPRPKNVHQERLEAQNGGDALYLVAWLGDLPVGHLLLAWGGHINEPVEILLRPCPTLADITVTAPCRSRGIGSMLMQQAEEAARQRGYAQTGVGVSLVKEL